MANQVLSIGSIYKNNTMTKPPFGFAPQIQPNTMGSMPQNTIISNIPQNFPISNNSVPIQQYSGSNETQQNKNTSIGNKFNNYPPPPKNPKVLESNVTDQTTTLDKPTADTQKQTIVIREEFDVNDENRYKDMMASSVRLDRDTRKKTNEDPRYFCLINYREKNKIREKMDEERINDTNKNSINNMNSDNNSAPNIKSSNSNKIKPGLIIQGK